MLTVARCASGSISGVDGNTFAVSAAQAISTWNRWLQQGQLTCKVLYGKCNCTLRCESVDNSGWSGNGGVLRPRTPRPSHEGSDGSTPCFSLSMNSIKPLPTAHTATHSLRLSLHRAAGWAYRSSRQPQRQHLEGDGTQEQRCSPDGAAVRWRMEVLPLCEHPLHRHTALDVDVGC